MPEDRSSVTWVQGLPVVTPPLEVDVGNAAELRADIMTASAGGQDVVIVDMAETAFCDSTGLNVLVRAHKQLEVESRQLRLVIREPTLLRIFTVTGMNTMFRISATLPEALDKRPGAQDGPSRLPPPGEAMAREDRPGP